MKSTKSNLDIDSTMFNGSVFFFDFHFFFFGSIAAFNHAKLKFYLNFVFCF